MGNNMNNRYYLAIKVSDHNPDIFLLDWCETIEILMDIYDLDAYKLNDIELAIGVEGE